MKVVILAGGFGTRISEESHLRPKPMITIGGRPILWHIMKSYSAQGYNDFVICAGYKQEFIKEWFANYMVNVSDVTFDFTRNGEVQLLGATPDPWRVTVVDTGLGTMTGGRVRRIRSFVGDEPFMLTYGDGVSDIDLFALEATHKRGGQTVTVSVYRTGQTFGVIDLDSDGYVTEFREKSRSDGSLINIGFMVVNPGVFDYLDSDSTILEQDALRQLSLDRRLGGYVHSGFWHCMDTQRDRQVLEEMWQNGAAPWKNW
ncbi:MAG: glucose-1-phosphate cytidylyltransferase [Propionibacteriaceae bacterium]|nr:glucose-1-phosphate cytidylyltransferase [Propionibacteriaceae bacterium]